MALSPACSQSNAHQSVAARLKTERRQAATARQERDSTQAQLSQAREEASEARRKEEAAKAALHVAKREVSELRRAYSIVKEETQHSDVLRDSHHTAGSRVAAQRDVALQEVGALAHELETLQEALASPQRHPRASRAAASPTRRSPHVMASPGVATSGACRHGGAPHSYACHPSHPSGGLGGAMPAEAPMGGSHYPASYAPPYVPHTARPGVYPQGYPHGYGAHGPAAASGIPSPRPGTTAVARPVH